MTRDTHGKRWRREIRLFLSPSRLIKKGAKRGVGGGGGGLDLSLPVTENPNGTAQTGARAESPETELNIAYLVE